MDQSHRAARPAPVPAVTTQDGKLVDDGRKLDPSTVLGGVPPVQHRDPVVVDDDAANLRTRGRK